MRTGARGKGQREIKILLIYVLVISCGLSGIFIMLYKAENPASLIVGEWKELSWEYEMADTGNARYAMINDKVKELIGENLVIHKSEVWHFLPNGQLKLYSPQGTRQVNWKLSGRGHILELKHLKSKEDYNIIKLSDDRLVINFDTDFEVRGIAKLTFTRIKKQL